MQTEFANLRENLLKEMVQDFSFESEKILDNIHRESSETAVRKLKKIIAASNFVSYLANKLGDKEELADIERLKSTAIHYLERMYKTINENYASSIFTPGKDSEVVDPRAEVIKEAISETEVETNFFINRNLLKRVASMVKLWRARVNGEEIFGEPLGGNKLKAYFYIDRNGGIKWFLEPKPVYIQGGWIIDPPEDTDESLTAIMVGLVLLILLLRGE